MNNSRQGFVSISVVYTFLILFIFLMLAILASYVSRETLLSSLISQAKEIIHGGISEDETDPNIVVKVYIDGVYSKLFPSYDYYSYDSTASYCTNGATLAFSFNDWSATINNINGKTTCFVEFISGESNVKPDPDDPDDPPVDPEDPPVDPEDPPTQISNIILNMYADGVYTTTIPSSSTYNFDPYSSGCTEGAILTYNSTANKVNISNIYHNTTCDAYFTTSTPQVTSDYILNGNISLSVYVDNIWMPVFPSSTYYKYNPYKSVCTDNAILSFNSTDWTIDINNITDKASCAVYFASNDIEITPSMFSSAHVYLLVYIDGDLATDVPDPAMGYTYTTLTSRCTNGATLNYNSVDNNFDIEGIVRNTECFAYFNSGT